MSKIDEKMLMMMVDMAAQGGKMEALQEAKDKEIDELRTVCDELRREIAKRDERIAQLEALVFQQENVRPQVVVNQFFVLSVSRTRVYVSSLSNNGRQFVGHMLHHTLAEDTPRPLERGLGGEASGCTFGATAPATRTAYGGSQYAPDWEYSRPSSSHSFSSSQRA